MGKSQRNKGAAAEREVAHIFIDYGYEARRGQCFDHEPDVLVNLPIHVEVKRQEKLALPAWIRQSEEAAKDGETPTVIFRQNRGKWYIVMELEEFLQKWQTKIQ